MSSMRTFVAVEVSESVRSKAADLIERLRSSDAKVSWVARANMHITLKFLGDLTDDQVAAVCQAVQRAAKEVPAFEFACYGAGAFPNVERPRTVWVGITDGLAPFQTLHAAIDSALLQQGFPAERRGFRPHLTLGRVRSGGVGLHALGQQIKEHADLTVGQSAVDEVLVLASHLRRSGAEYEVLATARLEGQ